jgi:hypothetical protein
MGSATKHVSAEKTTAFNKGLMWGLYCKKAIVVTGNREKSQGKKAGETGIAT